MPKNALFKSLLIFFLLATGCQTQGSEDLTGGKSFVGGNSGLSMSFIENSPPREVFDGGQFPFQVLVIYENVGEANIEPRKINFTLKGIFPKDFLDAPAPGDFEASNQDLIRGARKDPDGNTIRGGIHQQGFPQQNKQFKFNAEITGIQEFPLRLDACYEYKTQAVSSICIRKDVTQPESGVCRITGARDVSNSGAPVRVASVKENVAGIDSVLINFGVEKSGSGEIYAPERTGNPTCPSEYNKRNRVHVTVSMGDADLNNNLNCIGLLRDNAGSKRSGELVLTGGRSTFSCIQKIPDSARVDAVKGIQVDLLYHVKESIQTRIFVKSQLRDSYQVGGPPTPPRPNQPAPIAQPQPVSNPDLPDLSVPSIEIENLPSRLTAGQQYTITAMISNVGSIASPETRATLEIVRVGGRSWDLGTYIIPQIDADETFGAIMRFDLEEKLAPGNYYFYVRVNPQSTFDEIDEDNNYSTTQPLYVNEA